MSIAMAHHENIPMMTRKLCSVRKRKEKGAETAMSKLNVTPLNF